MNTFLHKTILRAQLRFYKFVYKLHTIKKSIVSFFYYIYAIIKSSLNLITHVNKSARFLFIGIMALGFLGSGLVIHHVFSQDFSPSDYSNYTQQQATNNYEQALNVGRQVVEGTTTTDSRGNPHQTLGLLNFATGLEAFIYSNNPVSFKDYAQYYAQKQGFIKSADAQAVTGSGYSTLSPVIPLWEVFRNVAYLAVALMIVVVGFVIIFGGKYGQSEITVISSIPNIVFALILITFSYPLSGLAIDIANLGTNVVVNVLAPQFVSAGAYFPGQYPVHCSKPIQLEASRNDVSNIVEDGKSVTDCGYNGTVDNSLGGDFNIFRLMSPIIDYQDWSATTSDQMFTSPNGILDTPTNIGILDALLTNVFSIAKGPAYLTIVFILDILMLFITVRILILVITSFVRIVISAMLSPLMFIALPLNGADVFFNWMKGILSPALVFPAVFAMMFIAAILAYAPNCYQKGGTGTLSACAKTDDHNFGPWYISPNTGITNFNSGPALLVDTFNPLYIWNIVAIGIVAAIPSIGKQLDEALNAEVSQHLERHLGGVGQRAASIAGRVPIVGGLIRNVLG